VCHQAGRPLPLGGVDLALSTALAAETPQNLLNLILRGVPAADGVAAPVMPPFAAMDDTALTALLDYLRRDIAGRTAWPDLAAAITAARRAAAPKTTAKGAP
ncbi:cytochrome c, partial [Xanthobacter autotrophicus]